MTDKNAIVNPIQKMAFSPPVPMRMIRYRFILDLIIEVNNDDFRKRDLCL